MKEAKKVELRKILALVCIGITACFMVAFIFVDDGYTTPKGILFAAVLFSVLSAHLEHTVALYYENAVKEDIKKGIERKTLLKEAIATLTKKVK